jgi:hypothetical protein
LVHREARVHGKPRRFPAQPPQRGDGVTDAEAKIALIEMNPLASGNFVY